MHHFSLRLARMLRTTELDAVLGHEDMIVRPDPGGPGARIWVRRAAPTPLDAMLAAVRDLDVLGLPPVGATDEDLVTIDDIAHRTRRSRTAVRLWAGIAPGRGRFPEPAVPGPPAAWRWTEVAEWLHLWLGLAPAGYEPVLSAVDLALRLRALAPRISRMAAVRGLVPGGGES